jgi:hypothetical protein
VVDYTKTSVESWIESDPAKREVDLVIDIVGGRTLVGLPRRLANKRLSESLIFIVESLGSDLAEIRDLIENGKPSPVVGKAAIHFSPD